MKNDVTLALTRDQALVLFELIARMTAEESAHNFDQAEEAVCSAIEAQLEVILVEPFAPNYAELLEAARRRILAQGT